MLLVNPVLKPLKQANPIDCVLLSDCTPYKKKKVFSAFAHNFSSAGFFSLHQHFE